MILDNSTLSGAIPDTTNPMANLQVGGWDGLNPGLGVIGADGVARSLLVANQPYVKRPSIFIMLTYPMAFNYYNNKAELINAYKNLLERRAATFEGLNNAITLDLGETPIGGTNEVYKTVLDSKKEASNIVFGFNEKDGKPIYRWHEWFINNFIMHFTSKIPEVTLMSTYINTKTYDAVMYSISGLVIEPDVSGRYVVDAYLGENIFPSGTGESTAAKNRSEAGTNVDITIEYGGYWQSTPAVRRFAQEMLNTLIATQQKYDNHSLFIDRIDPYVLAAKGGLNVTGRQRTEEVGKKYHS